MLQKEMERVEPQLTVEERSRLSLSYQQLLEQGLCRAKLSSSLLGFAWSQFEPRVFPDRAEDPNFRNPPEFLSFSFVSLDAYVTAMLAARLRHGDYGQMTFCCRLQKDTSRRQLQLEFVTGTERGTLPPGTAMMDLLSSLPQLLQMKQIFGEVCYMSEAGCRMLIPYPGKMVAERCPALRDRPHELWPAVTLRIHPTKEMVGRANGLVQLAWDEVSSRRRPN
jgi:hypothetical protein